MILGDVTQKGYGGDLKWDDTWGKGVVNGDDFHEDVGEKKTC